MRSRYRAFALALVILPLAALAGAIVLARSSWFMQHAVPPYLRMLDQESAIRNRECAILIYGDSTALTGFVPSVIQQDTGLRTCNIAQTKGTVGVSGLQFLREYLAHNPAPRVLVIAFSPEDWRHITAWSDVAYVEGVLQMVRRQPVRVWAGALASHPNEAFGFATFVYKSTLASLATHGRSATWPSGGSARDGHMTLPKLTERSCVGDNLRANPAIVTPSPEYVRQVRREFSSPATTLLLLTPTIPDCDALAALFAGKLDGVLDAPVATQPITFYNDSDRHFTAEGSEVFSHRVAALVNQRLGSSGDEAIK